MRVFPGIHEVGSLSKKLRRKDLEGMSHAEIVDWLIRFCAFYDAATIVLMELATARSLGNAPGVVAVLERRVKPLLDEILEER